MNYDPTLGLEVIDAIAPKMATLGPMPLWSNPEAAFAWQRAAEEVVLPLRAALEKMEPFKSWPNTIINTGAGGLGIQPMFLAPRLAEIIGEHGAEFAKATLTKLLSIQVAEAAWIALVWGLNVDDESDLGSDLSASMMDEKQANRRYMDWRVPWHVRMQQRPVIFRLPFLVSPVLLGSNGDFDCLDSTTAMKLLESLRAEVLSLNVLCTTPVVLEEFYIGWTDPHLAVLSRAGRSYPNLEIVPGRHIKPVGLESNAKVYLEDFRKLKDPFRAHILTVLDRLNVAKSRSSPSNQMLDVCIAIEMLLTSSGDHGGGIVNRLSLRVALYLGDSLEDRRALRKAVSDAYNLRSRVAHGGSKTAKNDESVAADAIKISNKLVRRIVAAGHIEDWQTLELNPPALAADR